MRTWIIGLGLSFLVTQAWGEYREIKVENGAVIEGQVRAIGKLPTLPPQAVLKQVEYCGATVADPRLVVGENGSLANVVVFLTDIKAGKAARLDQPVKLDNKKCAFVPHVLSATIGQTLEIHNSDPFLHDAHATLGARTLFNVGILSEHTVKQPLLEAGRIHFNCDVRHTWMQAELFVAEHPYHAVTDGNGHFRLDNVPPGTWTLRAWHELLGSVDQQVRLQGGENRTIELNLRAPED